MKSFRKMFRGYAVALAAALFMTTAVQAVPQHNKGVVRAIRDGVVEVSKDKGKTWSKASVGTIIQQDTAIRTDANATADIFLGDNGPVVRVTKGTTLGFDKLDVESVGIEKVIETQLDLKNGRILGNVKKMAAASKYEVKTPVGVAGIRGTEYSISADGTVNVVSGTVVVVFIVGGVPQPAVTVTQGNSVTPPPTNGGVAVITPTTLTADPTMIIPTVVINGTEVPTNEQGEPIIQVIVPPPPANVTPGPITEPPSDTVNTDLTKIIP
jgi:hypothetical protein